MGIGYAHDAFHDHMRGPVLHFRLTTGQTVEIHAWDGSCEVVWIPSAQPVQRDDLDHPPGDEVFDVLHQLWNTLNAAYEQVILPAVLLETSQALYDIVGTSTDDPELPAES